jgi:signal transduction histidine kinase
VSIAFSTDESLAMSDLDLLSRVLDRLLERAMRQARPGTQLDVQQEHLSVSIRAETCADLELAAPTLAMYFAEAAMAALGGAVWVESEDDDVVVYRVTLPR